MAEKKEMHIDNIKKISSLIKDGSFDALIKSAGELEKEVKGKKVLLEEKLIRHEIYQAQEGIIIEGIEDPFNFGYICRSLYAAGCHGLIVPTRNFSTAVTTVTKSSAGASEYINIIASDDIPSIVRDLQSKGIHLYCAFLSRISSTRSLLATHLGWRS